MTTRQDLRERVRAELGDGATPFVWSDGQLDGWLAEGLKEWSVVNPPERALALQGGVDREYILPVPLQRALTCAVNGVQWPDWAWQVRQGGAVQSLRLQKVPGDGQITLTYEGYYTLPGSDGGVLDLPSQDEWALIYFVCWRAHGWLDAQRDKVNLPTTRADSVSYAGLYREQKGRRGRFMALSFGY